jgi:hypothetical protein
LQNQGLRDDIGKDEGPKCKVPENGISRNYFAKEKPVDQVHESVDRAGLVHHGPAAVADLRNSSELRFRPLQGSRLPRKGEGRGVRVREPIKGRTGGRAVARRPSDGGKRRPRSVLGEVGLQTWERAKEGGGECGDGQGVLLALL